MQTFFDAVDDGTEYSEFRGKKSNWDEDAYKERLVRLCRSLAAINADVFALMEIENEGVIRDIENTFPEVKWGKNPWHYAAFAKNEGSATGCAVLSRYPLEDVTVHNIDIRTSDKEPPLRPIICMRVKKGSGMTLIVNHWKSKSGGETETEHWRDYQEGVLCALLLGLGGTPVAACGDFNRDLSAFDTDGTAVHLHDRTNDESNISIATMTSAWSMASDTGIGSYYYNGKWEKIDHIFVNSSMTIDSFSVLNKGDWATSGGKPRRYTVRTRSGYADHLPIMAAVHW